MIANLFCLAFMEDIWIFDFHDGGAQIFHFDVHVVAVSQVVDVSHIVHVRDFVQVVHAMRVIAVTNVCPDVKVVSNVVKGVFNVCHVAKVVAVIVK